jgi:small subunit ribosomal protein S20
VNTPTGQQQGNTVQSPLVCETLVCIYGRFHLANTDSALKRIRSNERKRNRNRLAVNRSRSAVRKARLVIRSGSKEESARAVREAIRQLDRAAERGRIHKNNAARRKSRLMKAYSQTTESQKGSE